MKKPFFLIIPVLLIAVCSCDKPNQNKPLTEENTPAIPVNTSAEPSKDEMVKRGKYLVAVIGCGDCHTPKKMTDQGPVPDMDRFLSGYDASQPLGNFDKNITKTGQWVVFNGQLTAAAGPWGVSFAANLTPDATGLGNWKLENFKKAIREGKYKGMDNTRPLLPPMPWQNFANLEDADLEAMFAYLQSITPIKNLVPNAMPPS